MSPTSFHRIWQMIANHSIFSNNSNNPQFDPRLQFLIVLYCFEAYGNGASRSLIGNAFHTSPGIIEKFTKRIIVALIETLESRIIEWPSPASKEVIKQAIALEHGFQKAIGMIDGTHIILAYKPTRQGKGYFNRKSRYSLQCMIVSDHNCRILHMSVGFTSASHDTRVFMNFALWLKHAQYFSGREYLLADTGYSLTKITMSPYKNPSADIPINKRFNY